MSAEEDVSIVMGDPTVVWSMGISRTLNGKTIQHAVVETNSHGTLSLEMCFRRVSSKEEFVEIMSSRAAMLWDRWKETQC